VAVDATVRAASRELPGLREGLSPPHWFRVGPSRPPLPFGRSRFAGRANRGDASTTPLPTNPDNDQLRRQAEELLQQARPARHVSPLGRCVVPGRRAASTRIGVRVPELATPPPRGYQRPWSNQRAARRPPRLRRQDDGWRCVVGTEQLDDVHHARRPSTDRCHVPQPWSDRQDRTGRESVRAGWSRSIRDRRHGRVDPARRGTRVGGRRSRRLPLIVRVWVRRALSGCQQCSWSPARPSRRVVGIAVMEGGDFNGAVVGGVVVVVPFRRGIEQGRVL